jgi:hypothetical protein
MSQYFTTPLSVVRDQVDDTRASCAPSSPRPWDAFHHHLLLESMKTEELPDATIADTSWLDRLLPGPELGVLRDWWRALAPTSTTCGGEGEESSAAASIDLGSQDSSDDDDEDDEDVSPLAMPVLPPLPAPPPEVAAVLEAFKAERARRLATRPRCFVNRKHRLEPVLLDDAAAANAVLAAACAHVQAGTLDQLFVPWLERLPDDEAGSAFCAVATALLVCAAHPGSGVRRLLEREAPLKPWQQPHTWLGAQLSFVRAALQHRTVHTAELRAMLAWIWRVAGPLRGDDEDEDDRSVAACLRDVQWRLAEADYVVVAADGGLQARCPLAPGTFDPVDGEDADVQAAVAAFEAQVEEATAARSVRARRYAPCLPPLVVVRIAAAAVACRTLTLAGGAAPTHALAAVVVAAGPFWAVEVPGPAAGDVWHFGPTSPTPTPPPPPAAESWALYVMLV